MAWGPTKRREGGRVLSPYPVLDGEVGALGGEEANNVRVSLCARIVHGRVSVLQDRANR